MQPGVQDYTLRRGADFREPVALSVDDVLQDLSDYKAWLQVRDAPADRTGSTLLVTASTESGESTLGASITYDSATKHWIVYIPRSVTDDWDAQEYYYDLYVEWPGGADHQYVLEGTISVSARYTVVA